MKLAVFLRTSFLALGLLAGTAVVNAQDLNAVRARMEQRLSAIDALKERQLVGENNRGYLEPRASLTPADDKVLSDENSDRGAVYAALAAQTGSNSDLVGRQRAKAIAASSRRGVWIQAPDGSWFQKN